MIRYALFVGLVSLAACAQASAQTVWDGELSVESFEVTTSTKDPGEYTNSATISEASLGTFSFDFGAVGATEFSFTWAAPPGQLIEIAIPGDAINAGSVRLRFSASDGGFIRETDQVSYEVFGASGATLPAAGITEMVVINSGMFTNIVWTNLTVGETYRFQSITGTATVSAGVDDNHVDIPVAAFEIQGTLRLPGDGTNPVGQWIRLVPALSADLNGDCMVDTADLGLLISAFGSNDETADINGDGVVDTADLGLLIGQFGMTCDSE